MDCRGLAGQRVSLYLGLALLNDAGGTYEEPLRGGQPLVHCHLTLCYPSSCGGPWYAEFGWNWSL